MKKLGLFIGALCLVVLGGCNTFNDVTNALNVVGQVITVAQADIPVLQAAGTLNASDVTALGNWLGGANLLLTQAQSCVATVGSKGSKSAIAPCVTAFGTGLLSPTEMADLRIISPGAQKQVAIYVTAVILAANAAADIVSAIDTPTPVVGSASAPTAQEMNQFKARLNLGY